jgi:molecular chaperone HscB
MDCDPFSVLGLPRRFDLDPGVIERAYLSRVAALHPDLARGDPEAPARAAALNDARAMLADPEKRAEVLLGLMGGSSQTKALPEGLLQEMLEAREALEMAQMEGDRAAVARWRDWAEARRAAHIERVRELFEAGVRGEAGALDRIRRELNAWRYVERMLEQMHEGGPTQV